MSSSQKTVRALREVAPKVGASSNSVWSRKTLTGEWYVLRRGSLHVMAFMHPEYRSAVMAFPSPLWHTKPHPLSVCLVDSRQADLAEDGRIVDGPFASQSLLSAATEIRLVDSRRGRRPEWLAFIFGRVCYQIYAELHSSDPPVRVPVARLSS
jgi:hypothetical protein